MSEHFIKLADINDLEEGNMRCITVDGRGILLANIDGKFYATDEMCTHEDARLCTGSLKNEYVKCPLHGSRFNLKTGKVIDDPADEDLRTYPLQIEANQILICLD
ncbi:MAG: non-heme iron oxygenase ferredoxin subunit [Acidiferrobacterales bacterium]